MSAASGLDLPTRTGASDDSTSRSVSSKRGKGRPGGGDNSVGRAPLLAVVERLLRHLPPTRVTMARVAREANVHPELVAYYFGNRARLLADAVDHCVADLQSTRVDEEHRPLSTLTDRLGDIISLAYAAPFLHRVVAEEIGTEEDTSAYRRLHLDLIDGLRTALAADRHADIAVIDVLLLYIVVLGAAVFFSSAKPLIVELQSVEQDFDVFAAKYRGFLIDIVLDGIRRR